MKLTNEMVIDVKKAIMSRLIPEIILASKNRIVGYKYALDPTDITDNNNLKLAREVSDEIYQKLPEVLQQVADEFTLGEN